MAWTFFLIGLTFASVGLIAGAVPSPTVPMAFLRRTEEPEKFYLVLAVYVVVGGLISLGSWLGG